MAYINPSAGVAGAQVTLKIHHTSKSADATGLTIPALQDVTVNAANDLFTWEQLDSGSKLQVATTATNSLSMNIVVDPASFFGSGSSASTAVYKGVWGLSNDKTIVDNQSSDGSMSPKATIDVSLLPMDALKAIRDAKIKQADNDATD